MVGKPFKAEHIIDRLREADVLIGQGITAGEANPRLRIAVRIYRCWRREYGGMRIDQGKSLKESAREKARLKNGGG